MPRTHLPFLLIGLGTAAFLLVALPGCKSDSSSTGVPTTITVTGKVISVNKLPMSNAPVVITGRPATATDANGNFTVTDVTLPYDVTVVVSASKLGITYRGLSRTDPTLVNFHTVTPANTATVSGAVSGGGGYPQTATRTSRVSLSSPEVEVSTSTNPTTGAFSLAPTWSGTATLTTILRALQWDKNAAGMPTSYVGYGEKTGVAIAAGGSFAGQNIAMTALSSQNISGTVIVPATIVLATKTLSLTFPNNGGMPMGVETGTATAFAYVVPAITGTTFSVTAEASAVGVGSSSATKAEITPGTTGIVLTIPDPTTLNLPVDAATGVSTTTPFSWTPLSSAIYAMALVVPSGQLYMVISGTNSGTIPDLTALGLGLPKSTSMSWQVVTYGPFANIDAAAGANGYIPQGDAIRSASSIRSFTTTP